MDARALAVVGARDAALFAGTHMAVGTGVGFARVHVRLAAFQARRFMVGEAAVANAVVDALLLVDVALRVGLGALRRRRQRVAVDAVGLGLVGVPAGLVLRGGQLRLLRG